ncbi:hypothetical protein BH20GEM2_BH20GEM2_12150 [soil metagenome]
MIVDFAHPLTREDRRSLLIHAAIVEKLRSAPESVLGQARYTLRRMQRAHPAAAAPLAHWDTLLSLPLEHVIDVLVDPRPFARELRHCTPFAGVLTAAERTAVYQDFAVSESVRSKR